MLTFYFHNNNIGIILYNYFLGYIIMEYKIFLQLQISILVNKWLVIKVFSLK